VSGERAGGERIRVTDAAAAARLVAERPAGEPRLLPTGTGTFLARGLPAAGPICALDVSGLDAVRSAEPDDMTIRVEAGIPVARLREQLAGTGQWLPPAGLPGAAPGRGGTVGGLIAADRRGPWAGGLGTVRDYLIGIRFVDGRGRDARAGGNVVKNVAGYDLMKLMTGSLGAFGVILEATFKVLPLPARVAAVRLRDPDPETCRRAGAEVPVRWLPAALWRGRQGDASEELVAVFAGSATRVGAQTAGVRAAWGEGAAVLEPEAARDAVRGLEGWGAEPGRDLVWGGALPARLAGIALSGIAAHGDVAADLLGGHVWARVPSGSALPDGANGGEPETGALTLNRDGAPAGAPDAWGGVPPESPVWAGLKNALDPRGVLVHGRLPGGI
jgi:glycolate oxidase FAD binding subunit